MILCNWNKDYFLDRPTSVEKFAAVSLLEEH